MNDSEIRGAVRQRLVRRYGGRPDTLILEELGLRHGASRVDLALINGHLEGFELKSEQDRLDRLPSQAAAYNSVLDRVTLVAAERHLKHAVEIVPEWWGVVSAYTARGGTVRLAPVRPARANPGVEPLALAKLLWRGEALRALEERGRAEGLRTARRAALYERLAGSLTLRELRDLVRSTLRSRTGWRPGVQ
jgi:hypothetical protein